MLKFCYKKRKTKVSFLKILLYAEEIFLNFLLGMLLAYQLSQMALTFPKFMNPNRLWFSLCQPYSGWRFGGAVWLEKGVIQIKKFEWRHTDGGAFLALTGLPVKIILNFHGLPGHFRNHWCQNFIASSVEYFVCIRKIMSLHKKISTKYIWRIRQLQKAKAPVY